MSMNERLYVKTQKTEKKRACTSNGENANVTSALAPKLTRTAILNPRPRKRKGKISEIINQPIGPKDICKRFQY